MTRWPGYPRPDCSPPLPYKAKNVDATGPRVTRSLGGGLTGIRIDGWGGPDRAARARSHMADGLADVVIDRWGGSSAASPTGASLGNGGARFLPPVSEAGGNRESPAPILPEAPDFQPSSVVSRWSLLTKIQRLCRPAELMERGPAVCGCGRPGYEVDSVTVHLRHGGQTGELRAGVSGVYRCGSPWLCPVCAVHKAHDRADRVRAVADATYGRGGQVALVVLTASHSADVCLADFKALVQGASRKARQGVAWTRIAERHEILGVVVGQEVTLSRVHGWHYHQHLVVPVDGPTDEEAEAAGNDRDALEKLVRARAHAAGDAVAERYKAMIRAAGGTVSDRHGTWVRVAEDEADAADYAAKGSMAWEVAGAATKDETKVAGSLTPWDIATAAYGGDGWARARWAEYVDVMPGTRSCVVSSALAKKLDIARGDDAEEGQQVLHEPDEIVGEVSAPTWRRWMRYGLASTFLARVERFAGTGDEEGGCEDEAEAVAAAFWGFLKAVELTDRDADRIKTRLEFEEARRERAQTTRREAALRAEGATEAAFLVSMSAGSGTRVRIREAIAELAAVRPDRPMPAEAEVVGALARVQAIDPWVISIAEMLGGRVISVEDAA